MPGFEGLSGFVVIGILLVSVVLIYFCVSQCSQRSKVAIAILVVGVISFFTVYQACQYFIESEPLNARIWYWHPEGVAGNEDRSKIARIDELAEYLKTAAPTLALLAAAVSVGLLSGVVLIAKLFQRRRVNT